MFKFRLAVLHCSKRQFTRLITRGYAVIEGLTGNALYNTPSPTLPALTTAIDDLQAAYNKYHVGGRGSTADYSDLQQKASTAHNLLKAMAEYVNNTAQLIAGDDYGALQNMLAT